MTTPLGNYVWVAFKQRGNSYQASSTVGDLAWFRKDPAETMRAATDVYIAALREISQWQEEVKELRRARTPLPARKAWELGNVIHKLNETLASLGCQLENMYEHFEFHAGLKSRRLNPYVMFRHYVDDKNAIPAGLKWSKIEKIPRPAGQAIAAGLPLDA